MTKVQHFKFTGLPVIKAMEASIDLPEITNCELIGVTIEILNADGSVSSVVSTSQPFGFILTYAPKETLQ